MKRFILVAAMIAATLFTLPTGAAAEALEAAPEALEAVEVADAEPLEAVEDTEQLGAPHQWARLWGPTALTTMQAVVRAGGVFRGGEYTCEVVIARVDDYRDALAAAGYAGMIGAPILMTDPRRLSPETREELERLKPYHAVIMGSTKAISKAVRSEIRQIVPSTERIHGATAVDTAVAIYEAVSPDAWGDTAIVATSSTFKDALSIAPYAYARHAPIFLANPAAKVGGRTLGDNALRAIAAGGFRRVVIVGSTKALPATIERQLAAIGVPSQRVAGPNAIATSREVALFAIGEGMGIGHMAVATTSSYKDALSAVPLCGSLDSVLVLCDRDGGLDAFYGVYDPRKVVEGYVIGGPLAISDRVYDAIARARG